jgi:hypothetical protein
VGRDLTRHLNAAVVCCVNYRRTRGQECLLAREALKQPECPPNNILNIPGRSIKEIVTINVTLPGRMSVWHSFGLAALRLVDVNCSLKTAIIMYALSHV